MSGLLVIGELEAFRTVLRGATAGDSEKVKLWSRSTVANALHRVGPIERLRPAADRAWSDADAFADCLGAGGTGKPGAEPARTQAIASVTALIEIVRTIKDESSSYLDRGSLEGTP